ncbi:hypothetical protein BKA56DRAFT_207915 [Ilyonectria sp. MPI-CAGE-AT-0026]|nr:hypothetical protein BKA56DRAFT_207915 [Ilyonectria sp. MPI-CAGE-AT-0026]
MTTLYLTESQPPLLQRPSTHTGPSCQPTKQRIRNPRARLVRREMFSLRPPCRANGFVAQTGRKPDVDAMCADDWPLAGFPGRRAFPKRRRVFRVWAGRRWPMGERDSGWSNRVQSNEIAAQRRAATTRKREFRLLRLSVCTSSFVPFLSLAVRLSVPSLLCLGGTRYSPLRCLTRGEKVHFIWVLRNHREIFPLPPIDRHRPPNAEQAGSSFVLGCAQQILAVLTDTCALSDLVVL